MKILAFDTSTEILTIALQVGDEVFEKSARGPREHSKLILTLIDELLEEATVSLADLDVIAVGVGPGSFTGLRTAVSVAQGLALANNTPVAPIISLEALAQGVLNQAGGLNIIAAIDARMDEVYWQEFALNDECLKPVSEIQLSKPEMIQASAPSVIAGSGVDAYEARIDHENIENKLTNVCVNAKQMLTSAKKIADCKALISAERLIPIYIRNNVVNQK